jgi:hypothetical protein
VLFRETVQLGIGRSIWRKCCKTFFFFVTNKLECLF